MEIKNRQQFLVVLTIAAAALFVGVNFIFTPLGHWWSARSKQITELRNQVKDGKLLVQREAGIRSHWSEMQSNALPPGASLAEQNFLHAVDDFARNSGAELTSVMPQWKSESTNYFTLNCRVESAGDLGALSRFIYSLEKGPMPLRLDTVELGSRDNNGQQMTLGLEINGLALAPENNK